MTGKKKSKQIFILIPAYNEAQMIGQVIAEVKKEGFRNIIVVDDGSSDDTYKIAKKSKAIVCRHMFNLGQGAALQTGFDLAKKLKADIVVTYDADGQFEAKDIKKIIEPILTDKCDIALGSRFLGKTVNIPFAKKIILKLGILFTNFFSNVSLTDTHNGFRALNKNALSKINIVHDDMTHASDIIDQINEKKLHYIEVPVVVKYTKYSTKKGQGVLNSLRILFNLLFHKLS